MTQQKPDAQKPDENDADLSFEGLMEELEGLVNTLENGSLSLEDSIATFERGMALTQRGNQILDTAEKKVEVLMQDGVSRAPLDDPNREI